MRKVYGEELSAKELKNIYFGDYWGEDPKKCVEKIVAFGMCWEMTEDLDYIIGYPTNFEDEDFPCVIHNDTDEKLTVWKFLTKNFEDLDLEEYTFYFSK